MLCALPAVKGPDLHLTHTFAPISCYYGPSQPIGSGDKVSKVMNDDKFNMSMRKFLKQVGVTSQRAIENLVREQKLDKGKVTVRMVLTAPGTSLNHVVEEELDLG